MLVLARERDQDVVLDLSQVTHAEFLELRKQPLVVTVVDIRGDKVRLGFTAPRAVTVHRREVWNAIQREREAARKACGGDGAEVTP